MLTPTHSPAPAPLSPAVCAILLSLAEGEKHGYQMMKDARRPEGGGLRLGPGTLYGSLERMQRDGLVEETASTDSERRRYYRLTRAGARALEGELQRLGAVVEQARRLRLAPQRAKS